MMSADGQIEVREVAFGSDLYRKLLTIREEVLRKPIGMTLRDKDTASDHAEFHIAAFDGERAVGCVVLKPLGDGVIQLRQMAIVASHQGRKIGAQLARYAESFSASQGFAAIETRAWRSAQGFYEKLGYESRESEFADEHTLKMRKSLAEYSRTRQKPKLDREALAVILEPLFLFGQLVYGCVALVVAVVLLIWHWLFIG